LSPPPVIDLDGLDKAGLALLGITAFPYYPRDSRIFGDRHQFAGIGDVNGDGRSEIVVGISRRSIQIDPDWRNGEVYLFWGRDEFPAVVDLDTVPPGLATVFRPFEFGDFFGADVAPAGDLNGDSVPDFLIGASRAWRDGIENAGEAYAVFSCRDFPPEVRLAEGFQGIRMLGEGLQQKFGASLSSAGDFNGDGALDIVVGTMHVSNLEADVDRIYVIYGSGSDRPSLTLLDISPEFGTVRGGTGVIVRGSGFVGEVSLRLGQRDAANLQVVSSAELRAVTPPGSAPGKVDVTVSVEGDSRSIEGGFEYIKPLPAIDVAHPGRRGFTVIGDGERRVGESMALGDITGDGAAELIIALTPEVAGGTWNVAVLHGATRPSGIVDASTPSAGVTVIDLSITGRGGLVAAIGDVDGDDIGDLGLGADRARGVIFFGRRELPPSLDLATELASGGAAGLTVPGASATFELAPAGDVDGDGIDDLAIGFWPGLVLSPGDGEVILLAGRRSWPEEVGPTRRREIIRSKSTSMPAAGWPSTLRAGLTVAIYCGLRQPVMSTGMVWTTSCWAFRAPGATSRA
jgi:hypothetical protein